MGLLEKAQVKKTTNKELKEPIKKLDYKSQGLLKKAKQKQEVISGTEKPKPDIVIQKITKKQVKTSGLLEKAKQKKQQGNEEPKEYNVIYVKSTKQKDIIEEKKGFGWKGQGTRRIIFDHSINEYVYEIEEPVLEEFEIEKKEELSRLFKMLADVNISELDKEKKEKYLEETLNQIIIDNSIRFLQKEKKDETQKGKKSFKDLFSKDKSKTKNVLDGKKKPQEKKTKSFKELISKGKTKTKTNITNLKKQEADKPKLTKEEIAAIEEKSKKKIFYHIFKEFLGYGKIDIIMQDEGIEDISCDGQHVPIFIYHKKYDAISTNIKFDTEQELDSFVVRLAQISGKQISIFSPIVDGKLPDGSRLQTTLAKTVTKGSTFTIRKFKESPLTPIDLIRFKSLSLDMAAYFWMAIEKGASVLFCGGTASGKTTALNALSLFIPSQNKIVSIEDTREVNLPHKNWIAGTTREGFSASDEKTGKDIDMFDLIRAALRQRPKVVIVGEVRGKEAYSLFQAMATGHTSYSTVHASDIHTLIQRLENPPISLPRALLTSLDIIVFQNAVDLSGKTVRRMTSVTEVVKLDPDTNQLIFMEPFRWLSKTDDRFESSGASKILNTIRLQNDWEEKRLETELENRKLILSWMDKKDIRDYKEVGRIVSEYSKYPTQVLQKAKEELKK